jgi:hypothetical protein
LQQISHNPVAEAHTLTTKKVEHQKMAIIDDKKSYPLFSKESISADIANQNFAGKRCAIAKINSGKISFKYHPFHQSKSSLQ